MPIPQQPSRALRDRFESRPSSAMGFSQSPAGSFQEPHDDYYYQHQHEDPHYNPKRASRDRQRQQEEDRKRMPPPPKFKPLKEMPRRPSTTAPSSGPFQAPPPAPRPASRQQSRPPPPARSANRRSINGPPGAYAQTFDEDDSDDDLFSNSPEPSYEQRPRRPTYSHQRRGSKLVYEYDDVEYEPAAGRSSRRNSVFVPGGGGASLENESRMDQVRRYQDAMSGGPPPPLTAENVKRASKGVPSSRSTRSSASRDESDYKQRSNTTGVTGITRSSSGGNGENLTMKIAGKAVVRIGDAEIDCEDSEITFSHQHHDTARDSIGGSDEASTVHYLEAPRRTRSVKALPHRPSRERASSQADSVSRGYGGGHQYAPYDGDYRY